MVGSMFGGDSWIISYQPFSFQHSIGSYQEHLGSPGILLDDGTSNDAECNFSKQITCNLMLESLSDLTVIVLKQQETLEPKFDQRWRQQ